MCALQCGKFDGKGAGSAGRSSPECSAALAVKIQSTQQWLDQHFQYLQPDQGKQR